MHIKGAISINNGWSILTTLKLKEFSDITLALDKLYAQYFAEVLSKSLDKAQSENVIQHFNMLFQFLIHSINDEWPNPEKIVEAEGLRSLYRQFTGTKNGVTVSAVGSNRYNEGDFVTNLFLLTPHYFSSGLFELSVILVPSQDTIDYLLKEGAPEDSVKNMPNEQECREQLITFGPISSKAPVVIMFYSPTANEGIELEELSVVDIIPSAIERTIEFAPEYYQAGVGLLSYFGEVLRQKDPNTKAKVRIEQDGRKVRLHIESPGGDIETVEKELDQYALVISNQAPPETLFEQRMHIMQLESRLEVAKVEIKNAHDLKQLTDGFYSQQIRDFKQQIDFLTQQVASGLLQQNKVFDLMQHQSGSYERMQMAMLAHGQVLFKDMLEESRGNFQLLTAIQSLHQNLLSGLTTIEVEEQIKQALETVKQQKPGLLARIYTQVEGAALKAGTGASLTWATDVIKHTIHP